MYMTISHHLILFVSLAYGISWLVFTPIILWHAPVQLIAVASFGPSAAALITHRLTTGNYRAFGFHVTRPWTLVAAIVGSIVIVLAYVVLPGLVLADPHVLKWSILVSPAVYNYSTLLGGPAGEEPGWRGYALPRLETRFGPVRATLLLALIWTGWHLPLFLVEGWTSLLLWSYSLVLVGVSVMMTWGVNIARFSVLTAVVMHAAFNTVSRFLNGLFAGAELRTNIPFEVVFPASGLFVAILLVVITRGRLAHHQKPQSG
jgi:membrane protease YdiL (CAAX protease family)